MRRMVETRWAMTKVVRPASNADIDAWMSCSRSVSRLLVARSRITICGDARIALLATRTAEGAGQVTALRRRTVGLTLETPGHGTGRRPQVVATLERR